ncbi:MAG: hypothetical protein NC079_00135 [Clostridium sp.]|nr:hypothetical protein [Acetatifactor muris]MCM1527025.1 hypothetical protein [Bacteroides sp.]MCM1562001.1 hypothetical protein [Clostridium sp.]
MIDLRENAINAVNAVKDGNWRELARKWFRRDNLIVMVLVGILLFVVALPVRKEDEENSSGKTDVAEDRETARTTGTGGGQAGDGKTGGGQIGDAGTDAAQPKQDYESRQESRLAECLSAIEGVGKVEVMLTFVSTEELVVEKDTPTTRSGTEERDSEGGSRTVTQFEKGESTVYRTGAGESEPYVIKTLNPRVEGVLVIAEGAGQGNVNRNITAIAQALFGVEAHKVMVVPMETGRQ